ncbi:MAG TPA: hypothetical protein GX699_02190, partial [Firmicutes bacterium]|nr:hypothetical protein [Bacillota bacterium]
MLHRKTFCLLLACLFAVLLFSQSAAAHTARQAYSTVGANNRHSLSLLQTGRYASDAPAGCYRVRTGDALQLLLNRLEAAANSPLVVKKAAGNISWRLLLYPFCGRKPVPMPQPEPKPEEPAPQPEPK